MLLEATTLKPKPTTPKITTVKQTTERPAGNSKHRFIFRSVLRRIESISLKSYFQISISFARYQASQRLYLH